MPRRLVGLLFGLALLAAMALRGMADPPPAETPQSAQAAPPTEEDEPAPPNLDEVVVEVVEDETHWPGLVSIFTRGGNWETDPDEAEAYTTAVEEAHFGGLMESLDKLELCEQHNLKLLVVGDWEEMVAAAPELVDNPNILGYYIADHLPSENIPMLAEWEDRFAAADPSHPALFTTEPRWSHYPVFIAEIQPRQVDFYYYQWQDGRDGGVAEHHFEQIEYYRDFARQLGDVRLSRWIHINSDVVKMRQSVSMSLAYDVRGFRWWVGWPMFDVNERDERGVPVRTEVGDEVASINQTIAAYAPIYEHLTYVDTYHTDPLPLGTDPLPEDHWFDFLADDAAVGEYLLDSAETEDSEFPARCLLIANRDIEDDNITFVALEGEFQVDLCDKKTGEWVVERPFARRDGGIVDYSLTIPPGGCELIRIQKP